MYTKANRLRKAKTEILVKKNTQLGVLRIGKIQKKISKDVLYRDTELSM